MSKARLVITALFVDHQTPAEVAARYGVHRAWVYKLKARYEAEGETALEPRSRRPKTSPAALSPDVVDLIVRIRKELTDAGLDAGPETIAWHLEHHHGHRVSRSTISRHLTATGLVTPEPKKRPKSSYIRFQASLPNETWQSDFTHYRLTRPDGRPGTDVEIISWLDDCTRYALHVSAHHRVTTPIVKATFRETAGQHGIPASTLTDNGMVYTVRLAGIGRRGGRNGFEQQLRDWNVVQKNSRPNHPTTCGKAERFQQTMKNWLRAQPDQPSTIADLQALIDRFRTEYNTTRPHRSLPHRATPATLYESMPKAMPGPSRDLDNHDRVRHDKVDKSGTVTLRIHGQLRHIGIGRTHKGTHVILLIQDLEVRIVNAVTGELLRELTIDTNKDYQPRTPK
jgi:transposase InsO family protein